LCAAQSALAEPAAPQAPVVATKTFQDWLVRCPTAPQALLCDAAQLLVEPQSKQRILSVSVAYDTVGARNVIRIILPLGVWLPNGVVLELPLAEFRLGGTLEVRDLISDKRFTWQGPRVYIELDPNTLPAHVFLLR
jgi:hypothetical protein